MITKAEYRKSGIIDIAPYLDIIKRGLLNRNMFICLGTIKLDGQARFREEIEKVMKTAGWTVSFSISNCRDDAGQTYIKLM